MTRRFKTKPGFRPSPKTSFRTAAGEVVRATGEEAILAHDGACVLSLVTRWGPKCCMCKAPM